MRKVLLGVALISVMSCGGDGRESLPASPLGPGGPAPAPQQTWTLSGTVSETDPTASTRIAGAQVQILSLDANAGRSATTDANGAFHFAALEPGTFMLRVQAASYIERLQSITLGGNQTVAIELDPVFQLLTTTRNESLGGGAACPGYWDYVKSPASAPAARCQVDYVFNVHHAGTLTAELIWADRDADLVTTLYRAIDGRPSGSSIAQRADGGFTVHAHTQYVLRVEKFALTGGSPAEGTTQFKLTVTSPN